MGKEYFIEIMAYVDNATATEHGKNLSQFILTVIHGADLLYSRPLMSANIVLALQGVSARLWLILLGDGGGKMFVNCSAAAFSRFVG